jgi:hypothetical protein
MVQRFCFGRRIGPWNGERRSGGHLEWNRVVARDCWSRLDGGRLIESVNPKGASSAESMKTDLEKVRRLANDLRKDYSRSPREIWEGM